jgi:hypothetical protein
MADGCFISIAKLLVNALIAEVGAGTNFTDFATYRDSAEHRVGDHFRYANLFGCVTALHCRTADGTPAQRRSIISRY